MLTRADDVLRWAEARNFFGEGGATALSQTAKLAEECVELMKSLVKGEDPTDDIGDCLVVLIILSRLTHGGGLPADLMPASLVDRPIGFVAIALMNIGNMAFMHETGCASAVRCKSMQDELARLVCTIARSCHIEPNDALEHAYQQIKDRRGSWVGGIFVKESQS